MILMITNITIKGVSQHTFLYLSIICWPFIFVIMVLLKSTTTVFWLNYVFSYYYILYTIYIYIIFVSSDQHNFMETFYYG